MTANKDIENQVSPASSLLPLLRTATEASPNTVDLAGYSKAAFVVHVGTLTDGTWTFNPQEKETSSGSWGAIAAADLGGSFTVRTSGSDETVEVISYLGTGRYIRCGVTVQTATSGGTVGVSVIRMAPKTEPQ